MSFRSITYSLTNCAHSTAKSKGTIRGEPAHPDVEPGMQTRAVGFCNSKCSATLPGCPPPYLSLLRWARSLGRRLPLPQVPTPIPEPVAVCQEHVQIPLQGVFIEGTAQPGPAAAHVRGDMAQGVEAWQLVLAEDLLHVEPEHRLCRERDRHGGTRPGTGVITECHSPSISEECKRVTCLAQKKKGSKECNFESWFVSLLVWITNIFL